MIVESIPENITQEPWRTFVYDKMSFGLMNVGANFQRAMDIAFVG